MSSQIGELNKEKCVLSVRDCDVCGHDKKGLYLVSNSGGKDGEVTNFICLECLHAIVMGHIITVSELTENVNAVQQDS